MKINAVLVLLSSLVALLAALAAGVPFTPGEMIGPVSGFVVLGLVAAWLLTAILRQVASIGMAK